ncbi:hypothetical protein DYQ05_01425 [Treponema pedis]|nr:hypothetical protein DYQ05_01425 [Treponema pedis]
MNCIGFIVKFKITAAQKFSIKKIKNLCKNLLTKRGGGGDIIEKSSLFLTSKKSEKNVKLANLIVYRKTVRFVRNQFE